MERVAAGAATAFSQWINRARQRFRDVCEPLQPVAIFGFSVRDFVESLLEFLSLKKAGTRFDEFTAGNATRKNCGHELFHRHAVLHRKLNSFLVEIVGYGDASAHLPSASIVFKSNAAEKVAVQVAACRRHIFSAKNSRSSNAGIRRPGYAPRTTGLPAAGPFLLGVQSLVQQHFEVRLVPQPLLGGEGSSSREVIFGQPDSDRWRRPGLAGPLACDSRHGSLAEFARRFGLFEAVRDKVLILRPACGLLGFNLEGRLFLGHMDHPAKGSNTPIDTFAQSAA
jgi:hypothetical protein